MWIQFGFLLCFCVLFFLSGGLFSKASLYLVARLPPFLKPKKETMRLALILLFLCNFLGLFISIMEQKSTSTLTDGYLKRPEQGSSPYEEELVVSDGQNQEKITVEVKEAPYNAAQLESMLEDALKHMDDYILGDNQSFDEIDHPLNLITAIPDTPIQIDWSTDKPMYLDWEGQIGEEVPKEGVSVALTGHLVAKDYIREYSKELLVFPEKLSARDAFLRQIRLALQSSEEQPGEYQYLPKEVDGSPLSWSYPAQHTGLIISGFSLLIVLLILANDKSKEKKEQEHTAIQLELDYPELVNKLILFMQAGISSRRAIRKIALDYKFQIEQKGRKRPAYEEILRIYYEMEKGISEEEAYIHLGQRCSLLEYRTLSTLLIQNLKKGSNQFLDALQKECVQAFEERKKRALIRGEEAGTKLLLPMGGMLLIVLLILMVPSLMTF